MKLPRIDPSSNPSNQVEQKPPLVDSQTENSDCGVTCDSDLGDNEA